MRFHVGYDIETNKATSFKLWRGPFWSLMTGASCFVTVSSMNSRQSTSYTARPPHRSSRRTPPTSTSSRRTPPTSTSHIWKMKKKQQKSKTSSAAATALDERRNRLPSPTSNFFAQMGDDEVGNHNGSSDTQTLITEPTASVSTASKSNSRDVGGDNNNKRPLLLFKSHAFTDDDDDCHYLSPQVTPTRVLKNSSPQSVTESVETQQATLKEFPRHAKRVDRLDRHDSSYEDSDSDIAIEDSSVVDDDASVNTILIDKAITDSLPPMLDKAISDSLPPMLNKFHDFIIGAPCWSSENMSRSLLCVGDVANANCNDINMQEDNDDDNNEEEHAYTSNDDDASFYTSDASSLQPLVRRRGRSPTIKEGYNSDGESLRSRSTCSRGSFWTDTNNTMDKSVESASHNSVDVTVIESLEQGGDANDSISSSASIELSLGPTILGTSFVSIDGVIDLDENGRQVKPRSVDSTVANEKTLDERNGDVYNDISTIAEELLTNDQANWICMTRDEASVGNADNSGIADSGHSEAYVEGTNEIENYFKNITTVGIQLILNDPPSSINGFRLNRNGRMFLKFGSKHSINGANDSLYLEWTDGYAASHTIDVFDIDSIRQPEDVELRLYPFAIQTHSFFISSKDDGPGLLFEAVNELQSERIISALWGIISRLTKTNVIDESDDWVRQIMPLSAPQSVELQDAEGIVMKDASHCSDNKSTFTNVSSYVDKKTVLLKNFRERRTRLLNRRTKTE